MTIPNVSNRFYLNDGGKFWHYRVEQLLKKIIYGIYNGYPLYLYKGKFSYTF